MKTAVLVFTMGLALSTPAVSAPRWSVQYFYDKAGETFIIEDLVFPSAQYGIAVGSIVDELVPKKPKYSVIFTSDGGAHWTLASLKENPRSLFFLNESEGWLVTDDGLWFTNESGAVWKKVGEQKKPDKKISLTPPGGLLTRVWFLDRQHGFATGLQKTVFETHDGGKDWTPVADAAKPSADPSHTSYSQIAFDGPKIGMIVGSSTPPRADDPKFPSWMEPERAVKRRQVPTLTILLNTADAGATWKTQTAPLFGTISSLRLQGVSGLAVFGFNEGFDFPSAVYRLDLSTGKSEDVFHQKDRRVTDCALFPGPLAFLAAVEPPGRLNTAPIPGKVKILSSTDFKEWTEMPVDYKANARSLILAGPDAAHQWAATDTGMILRLVP